MMIIELLKADGEDGKFDKIFMFTRNCGLWGSFRAHLYSEYARDCNDTLIN